MGQHVNVRAAYIESFGPASSVRVGELPDPEPGPTDVLVRVERTTVNPVDTYVRAGTFPTPTPFPFVVGRDLVGTVAAVGAGASARFAVGARVWCNSLGHGGRQGSAAELAVVAADRLYPLPPGADAARAVVALHPGATAFLALRRAHAASGDTIVIGGGAGNVGSAAVQIAADAGLRVIATASPSDHARCEQLGACAVIDYHDPRLNEMVRALAPSGVDVWWDTSGRGDIASAVTAMRTGGRILVTAHHRADPTIPLRALYTSDQAIVGFVISHATAADLAAAARFMEPWLEAGRFDIAVAETVGLDAVSAVHARIEDGYSGRVVVDVAETHDA